MRFSPPKFVRRLAPSIVWSIESDDAVFLTFDDGPTPGVTEWALEQLAKYDARATFFCLGKNAELYPDLLRRIVEAGHKIGNHTYSHQKGWGMSNERYVEDVDFANQTLRTELFRPPYGQIKPLQAKILTGRCYKIVLWDVLSRDYSRYVSPRSCLRNVTKHVRAGSVVVFHDSAKSFRNLRYALPRTLEHIRKMGLRCETIEL
ncbi:MAG: polysaccharide deacetylase family protein [Rikenellaceae bacterium]|jgi:peptidoglycan/xylan/chitin deacetylase (PgdA/CDA1 family)|nr:polysaccharide deacetylase family protein [Rikenellaceae bacterium]